MGDRSTLPCDRHPSGRPLRLVYAVSVALMIRDRRDRQYFGDHDSVTVKCAQRPHGALLLREREPRWGRRTKTEEEMCEQNKTLARRWFEDPFNRGDVDAADDIHSTDFVDHLTHEDERGLEEIKHHVTMCRTALPDIQDTVEDIVVNQAATQQSRERLRLDGAMSELQLPKHFEPSRVGEVWRVPYEDRASEAEAWAEKHGLGSGGRGLLSPLPPRRRRPEHVLHPGLRALRRRALGHGRGRRQPPPVRVRLPQPRHDHADLSEPRHPPCDAGVPRDLARRRARRPPGALHARLGRGRRGRPLESEPRGRRGPRDRRRLRASATSPTTRGGWPRAGSTT